jgi:hypothetical protein
MKLWPDIKGLLLLCAATLFTTCSCEGNNPVEPAEVTLSVAPTAVNAGWEAGTETVTVTASGDWGVSSADKDWCSVSPSGGIKGSSPVKVTLQANRTGKDRETVLTFRFGSKTLEVPVHQGLNEEDLPKPPPVGIVIPEGYHLVWNDEFDDGTTLDPAHWTHEVKGSGWVNDELQNYVNHQTSKGTVVTEIKDGSLHINCFKEDGKVYSGRVYAHVKEGWLYGWFEARIKLPSGKGTWPAFWMMPVGNDWNTNPWPMCGEIDIMEEVGCVPNEVSSSIHTQDYNHTKNTQKTHAMTISKAEGEYHVYALEWTEDAITTYVDGKVQLAVKKSNLGTGHNQWPFHYAFYPILNLAWGGSWGGMNGVDESALPVTMSVDYIRVFQKDE